MRSVPSKMLTLLEDVRPAQAAEKEAPEQGSNPLAAPLSALEPSKRQPHVEALVLKVVRALAGSDGVIVASTPLMEAGIDSLAATELANQLREATGLTLSSTLVFEHPTPRAIAAHVLEELLGSLGSELALPAGAGVGGGAAASESFVGVVSVAGRWPGGCEGVGGALWGMLQASGDAVGEVPAARWVLEDACWRRRWT